MPKAYSLSLQKDLSPKKSTIRAILDYSKAVRIMESKVLGSTIVVLSN